MNLHEIVSPMVGAVNPHVPGAWLRSTGYAITAAGKSVPAYAAPADVAVQVQALSGPDRAHLDGLNIQGVKRAFYLSGNVEGSSRPDAKGGDLITFESGDDVPAPLRGTTWAVAAVLEAWDTGGWSKVAVLEQIP